MPRGPYAQSDRDLLNRIGRSAGGKAGYKQLIRELGIGGGRERRLLLEQLSRMAGRDELVKLSDELWAIPKAKDEPRKSRSSAPSAFVDDNRSGRDRLVSGRLDVHRDGFGFVRPDVKGDGDIFIPPFELNGAMGGDLVLVDEAPPGKDGRRSGRIARVLTRRNPTVVGIFHYARPIGGRRHFQNDDTNQPHGNYVTPHDEKLGSSWISIANGDEVPEAGPDSPHRTLGEEARKKRNRSADDEEAFPLEGLAVDVEITRFPQPGRPALGRVIEVLGHPDDFGVDVEIIIRKHHIPHAFPPAVLAEANERAEQTVASLPPEELAGREDFREFPVVTIDGETAKDFDDAVHVRVLPNGNTELQVHIADVSHYVRPGSPLDTEARVRGNSVYFPDRAVPMLPHALSSGMCSLLPNEDRLVQSCVMEIDADGEIVGYRVAEGIIRSARRNTYTTVQHCINASPRKHPVTPEPTAEDIAEREQILLTHPDLPAELDAMLELALRLNKKRVRRGSIDFDLPEPIVQFDPDGNMKAIVKSERGWAHRLIEEFMLSANECVATWLASRDIASIYRIHEMPDPKRIMDFEETAAAFGQTLGIGSIPVKKFAIKSDLRSFQRNNSRGRSGKPVPKPREVPDSIPVTPQMYQKLISRISGHPEERILSYLMLRSLKQARYAEPNEGHFALASPTYTHFTSPIRRYPDLIVHRLLRAMLAKGCDPVGGPIHSSDDQPWKASEEKTPARRPVEGPISPEELSDIAAECSITERRAADAERELIEWKKMKFMASRVGEDFRGMVLSVTKYGFFVELDDLFIEGIVPLASIAGDHYTFRDTDRTIVGSATGHVFKPGQRVEVILDRIDRVQRRLQFALLPGTEPVAPRTRTRATKDDPATRPFKRRRRDEVPAAVPESGNTARLFGEKKKAEKSKGKSKAGKAAKKRKHKSRGL